MCTCQDRMALRELAECALGREQGRWDSEMLVRNRFMAHVISGMSDVCDDDNSTLPRGIEKFGKASR